MRLQRTHLFAPLAALVLAAGCSGGARSGTLSSSGPTTVAVGKSPRSLVFDGTNVWAANYNDNTVSKVNASTGAVVGTFAVGAGPTALTFDGTNVWVANNTGNTVSKLSASSGALLGTYSVDRSPRALAFDGTYVWVASASASTIAKLNPSNGTQVAKYTISNATNNYPVSLVSADGKMWFANQTGGAVSNISASGIVGPAWNTGGAAPVSIVFDGASIWLANANSGTLSQFNTSGTRLAVVGAGTDPEALAVDAPPAGASDTATYLWAANYSADTVTKVNAATGAIVDTKSTGAGPLALIVAAGRLWVANSYYGANSLTVIPIR